MKLILSLLLLIFTTFSHAALYNSSLLVNSSMATSVNSTALALDGFSNFAIYANFTGSPDGEIALEGSIDNVPSPTNWVQIGSSAVTVFGANDVLWNMTGASYKWVRVKYTRVAGTGVLNVTYNVKVGK